MLIAEARSHRTVLVADGPTLILVEPKGGTLPRDLLARIGRNAGAVIAALRAESFPRGRIIAVYDSGAP